MVYLAAVGLAVSAAATWILVTVSTRVQRRFRDKVTIALESHVARLQATVATVAHQERPLLPRPALRAARPDLRAGPHVHVGLRHGRLDPAPGVDDRPAHVDQPGARRCSSSSPCRPCWPRRGGRRSSGPPRSGALPRCGWPGTCSSPPPPRRRARRCGSPASPTGWCGSGGAAWERWYGPVSAARWSSAWWYTAAWAIFAAGYVVAIVSVAAGWFTPAGQRSRPATSCSCSRPGQQLSAYIGATVGEIGFLRGIWMDGSRRLAWLEDYAAAVESAADADVPRA